MLKNIKRVNVLEGRVYTCTTQLHYISLNWYYNIKSVHEYRWRSRNNELFPQQFIFFSPFLLFLNIHSDFSNKYFILLNFGGCTKNNKDTKVANGSQTYLCSRQVFMIVINRICSSIFDVFIAVIIFLTEPLYLLCCSPTQNILSGIQVNNSLWACLH